MARVESPIFEITDYLRQRTENPSFVMVELGHGRHPMVSQQPHDFTGQQAYIGIEAGMRDEGIDDPDWGTIADNAIKLRKKHAGINAFFLMKDLGPGKVRTMTGSSDEYWDGEFDPTTILPDSAADEVVASNVFCDPLIGMEWANTKRMLAETARLVTDDGLIVLRETMTPWKAIWMDDKTLAEAGLETVERITSKDSETWEKLEAVYGTHSGLLEYNPYPSAYYLFLGKATAQES